MHFMSRYSRFLFRVLHIHHGQTIIPLRAMSRNFTSPNTRCRIDLTSGISLSTSLVDGGKILRLHGASAGKQQELMMELHAVWLRHNCNCSQCSSSSGQRMVEPHTLIPSSTAISSAKVTGKTIEIQWFCGHRGFIDIEWLKNSQSSGRENLPLVAEELPRINAEDILDSDATLWRWLKYLNEYGLCLLTEVPASNGYLHKLGSTLYGIQSTIYGTIFEVVSKDNPENLAYSSNTLPFHQDLPYYESPPGLQFLHCLRNDECVGGGVSILLDSYPVLEQLRSDHPQHFATLTRVPATFQKCHFDRANPVKMEYKRPHIVLDNDGMISAFTWSPPFEGPLDVPKEDVVPYYEAYSLLARMMEESPHKITHRLMPGEVLTFNNRRCLHGRTTIILNGGTRLLEGTYINIDEFKSKFQILCTKLGHEDYPVRRVFNHCSF